MKWRRFATVASSRGSREELRLGSHVLRPADDATRCAALPCRCGCGHWFEMVGLHILEWPARPIGVSMQRETKPWPWDGEAADRIQPPFELVLKVHEQAAVVERPQ